MRQLKHVAQNLYTTTKQLNKLSYACSWLPKSVVLYRRSLISLVVDKIPILANF